MANTLTHTHTHTQSQSVAECEIYKNYPCLFIKAKESAKQNRQNAQAKARRKIMSEKRFSKWRTAAKIAATAAEIGEIVGIRAEAKSCQPAATAISLSLSLAHRLI